MMKNKITYLKHRTVLKVSGYNYKNFLNNIMTSDISKLKTKEVMPTALLSPQGRILFDLLISLWSFNTSDELSYILIECDIDQEDNLLEKLNMYNLRREFNFEKTNYEVFVTENLNNYQNLLIDKRFHNSRIARIYNDIKNQNKNLSLSFNKCEDQTWYNLLRYKNCVPEGPKEIFANISLPLEINLDLLGGISFEKGCFIGQEVNARVKWKGLIKKKYVPITLTNKNLSGTKIEQYNKKKIYLKDVEIGQIISLTYDKINNSWHGIGNIKLISLYQFEENSSLECAVQETMVKINFPRYMLPLPRKLKTS